MPPNIPITLQGPNLGARHRYLNSLVRDAYNACLSIEDVLKLPEASHVDRLFKIDLASKHKHLQYILQNLQHDDLLFVSRALKSKWLLHEQYRQIVNPAHLEDVLYPHMITTAVNKTKHWIYLNLRDPVRCQEFYEYYIQKGKDPDYALKFLSKCSKAIILNELPKTTTLEKITPQLIKMLCEKAPTVARLYYELLAKNETLFKKHSQNDEKYFGCIKGILKTDPDTFLDITEQYILPQYKKLSSTSTKFIMTYKKDRFMKKAELYTFQILDVNAIAHCLSPDECEHLVIELARAQYLNNWFNYKNVEPLVKRLDVTKRASFKKQIFIDKNVGELVLEWPYDIPKSIDHFTDGNDNDNIKKGVFLDEHEPEYYFDHIGDPPTAARMLCSAPCAYSLRRFAPEKRKTPLDALFDEYRFASFAKTLFELRKKLRSESSSQMRMYMFLVLVSKSGGKPEHFDALFSLLMEYKNEPSQVRAAVIRSLVKRVSVWRVTEDIWEKFLIFGRGLGLDGNIPEADCNEGLHAVIIRALLSNQECTSAIKVAFFKNYSTFIDYPLKTTEKDHIKEALFKMLVKSANTDTDSSVVAQSLEYAIDTLQAYKMKFNTRSEIILAVQKLRKNDASAAKCLLQRMFRAKLGRKELYRENFDFIQTDASYINVLKHDVTILSPDQFIKAVISKNLKANQFFKKISVYFMGNQDLAARFLYAIKEAKVHKNMARPIAYLIGNDIMPYMIKLDAKDKEHKLFSALIRANAHVARPALNIDALEWKKVGAKLIANKVITCKAVDIDNIIKKLLNWKKTVRLAIVLGQRTSYEADIFATAAKIRPTATLKSALAYIRRSKDQTNLEIWEITKPLILKNKDSIKANPHLLKNLTNVETIPFIIKHEYLTEAFKVISEIDYNKSLGLLCRIKNIISKVDQNFIEGVLLEFVQNQFVLDKIPSVNSFHAHQYHLTAKLHLNILIKYLLLSKSEDIQNEKFTKVVQLYLDRLQSYWQATKNKNILFEYIFVIVVCLRNTEVFSNVEYVSCLPVMEKFLEWMRPLIPVEQNFTLYVPLHLTMLYYKAIRQAVEQTPGLLDDKQGHNKAYKIIGETFGTYISQEARVLTKTYFDSIVVLYSAGLNNFFARYGNRNWFKIVPHTVKAIVNDSSGIECTLALQLYDDFNNYNMDKDLKADIIQSFREKDILEMQFCCNSWKTPQNYRCLQYHPFF